MSSQQTFIDDLPSVIAAKTCYQIMWFWLSTKVKLLCDILFWGDDEFVGKYWEIFYEISFNHFNKVGLGFGDT